jgi:hypothetical protein
VHPLHGARRVHPDFHIRVVRDAVANIDEALGDAALRMMERNMRVDLVTAADCLS